MDRKGWKESRVVVDGLKVANLVESCDEKIFEKWKVCECGMQMESWVCCKRKSTQQTKGTCEDGWKKEGKTVARKFAVPVVN